MEIFADGGLFELMAAVAVGYCVNYVFKHKVLLLIFSFLAIAASVMVPFLPRGELFYTAAAISMANSLFLVVLLWKLRRHYGDRQLFYPDMWIKKFKKKWGVKSKNPGAPLNSNN